MPEIGTLGLTRRELETCPREPDCGPERKRRSIHRPPTGGAPAPDPTDERRQRRLETEPRRGVRHRHRESRRQQLPPTPTATAPVVDSTTYSSWLNQVELWFSKVQRDVLSRGIFTSTADLARKLRRYIKAYAKQAKPFRWNYSDSTRRIPLANLLPGQSTS